MTRIASILMLVTAAALAGCDNSDHTIVAGPGANDQTNAAATANVTLPAMIAASKIYRCSGDNSVIYVDWLSDEKTANVRTQEGGPPTRVTMAEAGKPMTSASGLSLTGTAASPSVTVKLPEGATKTCKA